jgi:hypothetical protein
MFDAWKQAWRDAVKNFWKELEPEAYGADPARRIGAMRRDLDAARAELDRIEADLGRARRQLAEERESETTCRRREELARGIGDDETARIAAEFAARHAERAAILDQKVRALEAEHALMRRDFQAMESAFATAAAEAGTDSGPAPSLDSPGVVPDDDDPRGEEFRRLEPEARERAAEARLEELKRRMR